MIRGEFSSACYEIQPDGKSMKHEFEVRRPENDQIEADKKASLIEEGWVIDCNS